MEENNFGSRLLEYRKAHFLTQRQMGELLGVSTNHIGVLERGKKNPRPSTAAAFERLCGGHEERRFCDVKPMNAEETASYNRMWELLNGLDPDRRSEVLDVFKRILEWI